MANLTLNKRFCGFSMGSHQYWAWRVNDLCVYFMTGTPEGSTESDFLEKVGIEPATPGLQDIGFINFIFLFFIYLFIFVLELEPCVPLN